MAKNSRMTNAMNLNACRFEMHEEADAMIPNGLKPTVEEFHVGDRLDVFDRDRDRRKRVATSR